MDPVIIVVRIIILNIHHLIFLVTAAVRLLADCEANSRPSWEPAVGMGDRFSESEYRVFSRVAIEGGLCAAKVCTGYLGAAV